LEALQYKLHRSSCFFAIPKVDAAQLSTKIFSRVSNLKGMFGATHVIAFDYFTYDLESSSFQQLNVNQSLFRSSMALVLVWRDAQLN
jgi:hypothetical protein